MAQSTQTQVRSGGVTRRHWSPMARRNLINGLLFASPWIFGLAIFWVYPILASLYYSFTEFNAIQSPKWIGVQNFVALFADDLFWTAAYNTLWFAVVSIPLAIVCAFGLALLLNLNIRGRIVYRTIYFLPTLVPSVALALVWIYLFNFKNAFAYFKMGYASAMAWIMFLAILTITLIIFRSARHWVYYGGVDFT